MEKNEKLEEKIDNYKDNEQEYLQVVSLQEKNLLLSAEIENERKAHMKEIQQAIKYANRKILLKVVPLIENYKRALSLAENYGDAATKNFVIGFEMILNDFKDNLKTEGVEEYSPHPYKEKWNSSFCEVVDEVENNEYEGGTILEVIQNGYLLHKRLLSPAKVIVSKKSKNS